MKGEPNESRPNRWDAQLRVAAESLKKCPLCGAINAVGNQECFVCRWEGVFDHNRELVEEGLDELILQCPELAEAMMSTPARPEGFVKRLRHFWIQFRNRLTTGRRDR